MCYSWLLYYGCHEFHLSKQETDMLAFGQMIDLINCLAVANGSARQKHTVSSFADIMRM